MRIGCVHIPSFPAWVFERQGEAFRQVVVSELGRVIAVGHALRQTGIVSGMRVERARSLVPEVVVRVRDRILEEASWEEVLQEIHTLTPFLEHAGPGFAFFQMPEVEPVRALVSGMRVHAAMAPSRAVAQLGAVRAAAGNVLLLEPEMVRGFLDRYPTPFLEPLGFTADFMEQLGFFGYQTLGQASVLSLRHLKAQFGEEGARLYGMLHLDQELPIALYQPPPAVVWKHEFDDSCMEPCELLPVLEHGAGQAVEKLRGYTCQRIRLGIHDRQRDRFISVCRVLPEPSQNVRRLSQTLKTLLFMLLDEPHRVERIVIELGFLRPVQPVQGTLFHERPSVGHAIQSVHRKYPGVIKQALICPHALFPEDQIDLKPLD